MKTTNTFTNELPVDNKTENRPRQVVESCSSLVLPKLFSNPNLIHKSDEVLALVGLDGLSEKKILAFASGQKILEDFKPFAMCYGGHQFGNWAGQLGDGRAINVAEINHENKNFTLQLKGSGPTPYSRTADGFAVLRSSIREYLCSEAMHHLGISTTRAISLALTGESVTRDVLYNGNPKKEKGAVVGRVAESFIRFGSFEIHTARQDFETLQKLTDYTIKHHFTNLGEPSKETYLQFFESVCNQTRKMIVDWQRVGFVHGVMITDNMSILGLTIDYGPYGWLEDYNPNWTPNTTDVQHKRYRFGNQFQVSLWNLTQLANALFPLIEDVEALTLILKKYRILYAEDYQIMMLSKLGIANKEDKDNAFIHKLETLLERSEMDMTLFFRNLNTLETSQLENHLETLEKDSYLTNVDFTVFAPQWKQWLEDYAHRLRDISNSQRVDLINKTNPKYVLRNYMAQLAIEDAENNNYDLLNELYSLLKNPYKEQSNMQKWFVKRPDWAKEKVGCSMLSCSS